MMDGVAVNSNAMEIDQQQPGGGPGRQQQNGGRAAGGPKAVFATRQLQPQAAAAPMLHANARTSSTTQSQMTNVAFDTLSVRPEILSAIRQVMGYPTMTRVQAASIPVCLSGSDVLAKAKTGTGKTLSFLIPMLHRIVSLRGVGGAGAGVVHGRPRGKGQQRQPAASPSNGQVGALVISPTRELARQIEEEARLLCTFITPPLTIQCVVGGTQVKADVRAINRSAPDLLVGTPGRLNDLLENHGLNDLVTQLVGLALDEADQLLDMGFRPEIEKILRFLNPASARQTLLFSATMPEDVRSIARIAMSPQFQHVDTVGHEEQATHQHVPQHLLVTSPEHLFAELLLLLSADSRDKTIVFFTTARLTQFYAALFQKLGIDVLEIHSRKSQAHRTRVSAQFRNASPAVLFTSDVSARGMDYPDVSHVIQVGLPADRAQYIHRLGRTAHSPGHTGQGILILNDFEQQFVNKHLRDLPLTPRQCTPYDVLHPLIQQVDQCLYSMDEILYGMAYQSSMGFYNSNLKILRWTKTDLVANMNDWITRVCHAPAVPALLAQTVGKMGLRGTPGLVVEKHKRPRGQQQGQAPAPAAQPTRPQQQQSVSRVVQTQSPNRPKQDQQQQRPAQAQAKANQQGQRRTQHQKQQQPTHIQTKGQNRQMMQQPQPGGAGHSSTARGVRVDGGTEVGMMDGAASHRPSPPPSRAQHQHQPAPAPATQARLIPGMAGYSEQAQAFQGRGGGGGGRRRRRGGGGRRGGGRKR